MNLQEAIKEKAEDGAITLQEALNERTEEFVKIGSKTSFFYCWKNDEEIEAALNKLGKEELRKIKYYINRYQTHLNDFDAFWERQLKFRKSQFKKEQTKTEKFYKGKLPKNIKQKLNEQYDEMLAQYVKDKDKDLTITTRGLEIYTLRLNVFTPYLTRKVREIYPDQLSSNEIIILIEGLENGDYWCKEEYVAARGLSL